MKKLLRFLFHLVVSLNPDVFLRDAFDKQNFDHQFDYYSIRRAGEELRPPTADL